jgi:DNA-binding CsgD family transcriptional regulator
MKTRQLTYLDFLKRARKYENNIPPDGQITSVPVQSGCLAAEPGNAGFWPVLHYIIDYTSFKYIYLAPAAAVLGYTGSFLMDAGPEFLIGRMHPEDFRIMNTYIFPANLDYLLGGGLSQLADIVFTMTFRLRNDSGNYRQVSERLCVLNAQKNGMPLTAMASLIDISTVKRDNQMIHTIENLGNSGTSKQEMPLVRQFSPGEGNGGLSKREIDILKWACDGCSSKLIATKLHLSIHTVNNHRKNMLQKSHCKNITELLNHSIKNGII